MIEYPLISFSLLFFANILLLLGASHNKISDDFVECLSNQIGGSNYSSSNLIYTPQNPTYTSLLQPQNLRILATSRERPALIFTPFHESEIVSAIYCSKELGLQLRVRSGGHDYEGLSYTSENPFFIVDMRNFRSISIDVDKKTARVQVGATLGQFYHALGRKSKTLAFPAGVCPTVGVGGHFSGGGYGMISRKHAIASDRIIDARLINVDGQILERRSMGEDLFWAIRGGGGTSFGIILEFKVALATVPETVTFFNVARMSGVTQLVHRWQYIADKVDDGLVIRLFISVVNKTITASFESLYLGPTRDLLPLMKEQFPELGLVEEDCSEMSWIESVNVVMDRFPDGHYYDKSKSDFVSSPIPVNGLREIWKFLYEKENYHLQFSPYGGVLNTFSESETSFPHRKGNIFMIHYGVKWRSPDEAEKIVERLRRFYSFMERYVTKSPRAAYFNYRDIDIGRNNVIGSTSYEEASVWGFKYFKNNFKRLVDVKSNFDPTNFFRNELSIPPLPSHSWDIM